MGPKISPSIALPIKHLFQQWLVQNFSFISNSPPYNIFSFLINDFRYKDVFTNYPSVGIGIL